MKIAINESKYKIRLRFVKCQDWHLVLDLDFSFSIQMTITAYNLKFKLRNSPSNLTAIDLEFRT